MANPAHAQFILYSWEDGTVDGWNPSPSATGVTTSNGTIGATDGTQALSISQPIDSFHQFFPAVIATTNDMTLISNAFTGATSISFDISNPGTAFSDPGVILTLESTNLPYTDLGSGFVNFTHGGAISTITYTLTPTQASELASSAFVTFRLSTQYDNGGRTVPSVFTVDNLRTSAAAVPEPSTYAMIAMGLGVLGFAIRRRSAV